jgi:HD-GYP domain-containing protein (c-di-GMP phosphodiesterase class II)
MTSERPYRPAMSPQQALETISESANCYHPGVAAALQSVVAQQAESGA